MSDTYRKYGRRKAGSWGKPHKGTRKAANRATRTHENRDVAKQNKHEWDFPEDRYVEGA